MEIKEKGQQIYISFTLVYIDELIKKLKIYIIFYNQNQFFKNPDLLPIKCHTCYNFSQCTLLLSLRLQLKDVSEINAWWGKNTQNLWQCEWKLMWAYERDLWKGFFSFGEVPFPLIRVCRCIMGAQANEISKIRVW